MFNRLIAFLIRTCSLLLFLLGIGVAGWGLDQAWTLYHEPAQIERFAKAVEHSSHIDQLLANAVRKGLATQEELAIPPLVQDGNEPEVFRISYFLAWIIAILLLLLITRIAFAAVSVGAKSALYRSE